MVNIFSPSSLLRLTLAGVVAFVLLPTLRGDKDSQKLKGATRELDAQVDRLEARDTRPIYTCQTDPLHFPQELSKAPKLGSLKEEGLCDLELHQVLKAKLAEARLELDAGRLDAAYRLAMDLLRYNNSVPGRRSFLGVAIASTSAATAVQLLQIIAARSSSAEQRRAWQQSLEPLLAHLLDDATRNRAIVLGEVKMLRHVARQGGLSTGEKKAYRREIMGYADLLAELDFGGSPFMACSASTMQGDGSDHICSLFGQLAEREAHIDKQLLALREMLAERI